MTTKSIKTNRGMQVQRVANEIRKDCQTVQGSLMKALRYLKPAPENEINVLTSSRTDRGVHALCTTVSVDLIHPRGKKPLYLSQEVKRIKHMIPTMHGSDYYPQTRTKLSTKIQDDPRDHPWEYDPDYISLIVNKFFKKNRDEIRILKVRRVPDDFHVRYDAVSRRYMYRLAVSEESATPLEFNRCYHVSPPFDPEKLHEAAEILTGTHNFSNFTRIATIIAECKNPVKTLHVGVRLAQSILQDADVHPKVMTMPSFWEIHFECHSFFYKQVRRMVGSMLAYASHRISIDRLRSMVDNPCSSNEAVHGAPSCGLYLVDVTYHEKDLQMEAPSEIKELSNMLDSIVQCGKSNAISPSSTVSTLATRNEMNDEHTNHMSDKIPVMSCLSNADVNKPL